MKKQKNRAGAVVGVAVALAGGAFWAVSGPTPSAAPLAADPTALSSSQPPVAAAESGHSQSQGVSGRPPVLTQATPGRELRAGAQVEGELMATTKYQDYFFEPYSGGWIEVVGSMQLLHQTKKGSILSDKLAHWGHGFGKPMARSDAATLAQAQVKGLARTPLRVELKVLPNPERTDARLVYWVDFEDRLVVVDAESGGFVYSISKHRAIAALPKVKVYSASGLGDHTDQFGSDADTSDIPESLQQSCQLVSTKEDSVGTPVIINPERCKLTAENSAALSVADEDSIRALDNSSVVAQYFSEKHGRSSFDGQGTELVSVVHVGDAFDNAFWDEEHSFMAYGDGDGKASGSYTRALDIVGHEMTHGVTAATAKLLGTGEAGALNEAYSDFFGVMISSMRDPRPDWTIGKEISVAAEGKEVGMRSLAQPGKFTTSTFTDAKQENTAEVPFPSKVSEKLAVGQECNDKNDQCEVHGNSTIPGHASYLIAKALEASDQAPQNRYDRAAKLYYTVLTQWLVSTDGFAQAAKDTVDACKLMYSAEDCAKVAHAFAVTGMLN